MTQGVWARSYNLNSTPIPWVVSYASLHLLLHFQSPPLSRVVTPLSVVKDVRSSLGSTLIILVVYAFVFGHAKKALACCVVRIAAHCTLMLGIT